MKKGFSHGVAPDLIREQPGMTANEVAERALNRGLAGSDGKYPVQSLGHTLAKEVREVRLPEVVARKVGGVLRYYPASAEPEKFPPANTLGLLERDETVSIRLASDAVRAADNLVEAGKSATRSEALAWLVAEGIARNEPLIDRVTKAVQEIARIKASI